MLPFGLIAVRWLPGTEGVAATVRVAENVPLAERTRVRIEPSRVQVNTASPAPLTAVLNEPVQAGKLGHMQLLALMTPATSRTAPSAPFVASRAVWI